MKRWLTKTHILSIILILLFASIGTYLILSSQAAPTINANFNNIGTVDILDLQILATNWASTNATRSTGDANADGKVDILDLSALASQWGQTITPTPTPSVSPTPTGQPANSINVKDYSVVGNGTTDDTANLITAFNAAVAQNKIAYVPNGTYKVNNLVIPDNTKIQGQSMTSAWLKGKVKAGSNQAISYLKFGDFSSTFTFTNTANNTILNYVHFRGGGLSGAGRTDGAVISFGGWSGLIYQHHITIQNSEIERNLGVQNGDYTIEYNNISFTAVPIAGQPHVTDIRFESNKIGVSNGQGGHDTGSPRMNVEIWQQDVSGRDQVQGYQHIDFINNIFEAADGTNIDYAGAHNWSTGYCLSGFSTVSGNLFKGNGYLDSAPWASDITLEPACEMQITNNTFWGGGGYSGVAISSNLSAYGYSRNNLFKYNVIDFTVSNGINHDPLSVPFSIGGISNEFSYNTIKLNDTHNLFNIYYGGSNLVKNNNFTINTNVSMVLFRFGSSSTSNPESTISNVVSGNTFTIPSVTPGIYVYSGSNSNTFNSNKFYGLSLPNITDKTGTFQFNGNTLN